MTAFNARVKGELSEWRMCGGQECLFKAVYEKNFCSNWLFYAVVYGYFINDLQPAKGRQKMHWYPELMKSGFLGYKVGGAKASHSKRQLALRRLLWLYLYLSPYYRTLQSKPCSHCHHNCSFQRGWRDVCSV